MVQKRSYKQYPKEFKEKALCKENQELCMQKEILKKASAFFTKEMK